MSTSVFLEDIFAFSTAESGVGFENDDIQSRPVEKKVGLDKMLVQLYGEFEPIPLVDAIVITVVVIVLTIFFNTLVALYYGKAKTSNRPYVLALVVLDFVCVLFVMPAIYVHVLAESSPFTVGLEHARTEVGNWVYLLYLMPSFFLAVDRFMAVFFPHKFKLWSKKIRNFKIVIFIIFCLIILVFRVADLTDSSFKTVTSLLIAVELIVVTLGSFAMYIAIYVNLVRARKNMEAMQTVGNSTSKFERYRTSAFIIIDTQF